MAERIGDLLRALRTSRGFSLRQLAAQTALARRTISYWESNAHQPHIPELEAVLQALGATNQEYQQALSLIHAPRAMRQLREEITVPSLEVQIDFLPSGGELLRAMRHRQRFHLQHVAEALKVSPGTVSRWEQGKTIPPSERLDELLVLLHAHPQEKAALTNHFPFLSSSLFDEAANLDSLKEFFSVFVTYSHLNRAHPLHDLRFISYAAAGWTLASQSKSGYKLLAEVYAHYASYLSDVHRYQEAKQYAEWALNLYNAKTIPEDFYMRAAIVSANAAVQCGLKAAPERGLELLQIWLPATHLLEYKAWMMEDMARYHALLGNSKNALHLSQAACQTAQLHWNANELHLRQVGLAKLHLSVGKPEDALPLAVPLPWNPPFWRADIELIQAEAFLALGNCSDAQTRLQSAYTRINDYQFEHLRPKADELAQKL